MMVVKEGISLSLFHERLKPLREAAGLTQEALARAAGLSLSAVTKIERGGIDPSWSTVLRLAKALGVSTEAFANDAPQPPARAPGRKRRKE
jgi:transcriptional regulator with XRE-family HTH domain